jgi:pimeloyl-ACP methyl ester carboxylesterase
MQTARSNWRDRREPPTPPEMTSRDDHWPKADRKKEHMSQTNQIDQIVASRSRNSFREAEPFLATPSTHDDTWGRVPGRQDKFCPSGNTSSTRQREANIMTQKIALRPGIPGCIPDALIFGNRNHSMAQPLIVVHGIARETDQMAEALAPLAAATGRLVVLPIFDADHWKTYQRPTRQARADQALLRLLSALRCDGTLPLDRFDLAGFSGGAQFAHRFTWMYPSLVSHLTVASAGWWTFPDAAPFPYGMGAGNSGPAAAPLWLRSNLRAFLDREIVVRVGDQDNVVDRNTRSEEKINTQQGRDRLTRARRWVEALREAARTENIPDRVDFGTILGCGHDFVTCAQAGLAEVFLKDRSANSTLPSEIKGITA